jgi:hypothetical protein
VAAYPPNATPAEPVKLVPVTVTTVRPAVLPDMGLIPVTVGVDPAVYVNWSALPVDDLPLGVTTVMSMVPTVPMGSMAVNAVSEISVNEVAAVELKLTAVAPVKLLPTTAQDGHRAAGTL